MSDTQDRQQVKYDRRAEALRANLRRRKQQQKQKQHLGEADGQQVNQQSKKTQVSK